MAYSFNDVYAAITGPGGIVQLASGAGASDEGVSVEPTEDSNTMVTGADGSVMHSLHAGRSGTVTVSFLKTSPVNAELNAMMEFQRKASANHGRNTLVITDKQRGDIYTCLEVAFAKPPANKWGKDGAMLEWRFHAGKIYPLIGAGVPDINV